MEVGFYQTKWHGIDICDIAEQNNHNFDNLANSEIYKSLYEKMALRKDFSITADFVEEKEKLSSWLFDKLKDNQYQKSNILSLGCGLGLIELELFKKGIRVDLQESQEISIEYIKRFHIDKFKDFNFICSQDLSNIDDGKYDVVLAITCSYCLDRATMKHFLEGVNRVLKDKGIFIWYDTSLSFSNMIRNIYYNFRKTKHAGVFWGWKRSIPFWIKMARDQGFSVESVSFFDEKNNVVFPRKLFNIPFRNIGKWQAIILKK